MNFYSSRIYSIDKKRPQRHLNAVHPITIQSKLVFFFRFRILASCPVGKDQVIKPKYIYKDIIKFAYILLKYFPQRWGMKLLSRPPS